METYEQMLERQRLEAGQVMVDQVHSWKALRDQYGETIPEDVHRQWEEQYGAQRQNTLSAWHEAEREAYPLNPIEYRYQNEQAQNQSDTTIDADKEAKQKDVFEELLQKQEHKYEEPVKAEHLNETENIVEKKTDIFEQLLQQHQHNKIDQVKNQQLDKPENAIEKTADVFEQLLQKQKSKEQERSGQDYER